MKHFMTGSRTSIPPAAGDGVGTHVYSEFNPNQFDTVYHPNTGPGISKIGKVIDNYQTPAHGTQLMQASYGMYSASCKYVFGEASAYVGGVPNPSPLEFIYSAKQDEFVTWFTSELYSEMTGPSGLVFLGELNEVVALIKHPFKELLELKERMLKMRNVNIGYKKANRDVLRSLADIHLQYNFAVKPLISEAEKAIKLANKVLRKRRYFFFTREKEMGRTDVSSPGNTFFYLDLGFVKQPIYLQQRTSVVTRAKGTAMYRFETVGDFIPTAREMGLAPQNLAAATWELIPWSFLADYVLNIGNIIESHSVAYSQVPYGTISLLQETNQIDNYFAKEVRAGITDLNCSPSSSQYRQFVRTPLHDVVLPLLPSFTTAINIGQLRNMAALFVKQAI